jgi:putative hydrolase of the HAD superfamily
VRRADADNTLWDTDAVFADAQLAMLREVESALGRRSPGEALAFVRAIDQALAEKHHAGLRYPPRLLAQAVGLALDGTGTEKSARLALVGQTAAFAEEDAKAIEKRFVHAISRTPQLREGVVAGLDALRAAGCLILILTEGSARRIRGTAEDAGLIGHFDRIIEAPKHPRFYERVLRLTGTPRRAFMVGDQLDRDIAPASAAGLTTIYYPGGFTPRWAPSEEAVRPDFRIQSFEEVPRIVMGPICWAEQVA